MKRSRWERRCDAFAIGAIGYVAFGWSWNFAIVIGSWLVFSSVAAAYDDHRDNKI